MTTGKDTPRQAEPRPGSPEFHARNRSRLWDLWAKLIDYFVKVLAKAKPGELKASLLHTIAMFLKQNGISAEASRGTYQGLQGGLQSLTYPFPAKDADERQDANEGQDG